MKILVAVKQVAFLDDEFEMRDDGRDVDADFFEKDLNEFDHFSVEEAMLIKEAAGDAAEVVIAIIGDEDADDALRTALAKGADRGIRVWDDALADADGVAVARVLARVVEREKPDMVFTGAQSADFGSAVTGMALAGILVRISEEPDSVFAKSRTVISAIPGQFGGGWSLRCGHVS